jgi:hypothetical protein
MKLFTRGFWSGFIDKTNPVDVSFFIELFSKVFDTTIELGNLEDSDILLETVFDQKTFLFDKNWKYTFLFSGESRLNQWSKYYNCVLYGEKNHANIINVPLFIPMIFCSFRFLENRTQNKMPSKDVCCVISNENGRERNYFLQQLEKKVKIDYAGSYKNNVPKIEDQYHTQEFINKIADYKFIVTMENSRGETYITEKILHGFNAGIIPIYWGSPFVTDYFNENRFINVSDMNGIDKKIEEICELLKNEEKYMEMVKQPVSKNSLEWYIEHIVSDIKNLLFAKPFPLISKVYTISCEKFEKRRYERLNQMFLNMGLKKYHTEFICPTYKQTITNEIMNKYVKYNLVKNIRPHQGMKKAEVSLMINYKAVLDDIYKNYSDGLFLIFESDVIVINEKMHEFNDFLNVMESKKEHWDVIHIGKDSCVTNYFSKPYCDAKLPYRNVKTNPKIPETYIEDITNQNDRFRLVRVFHTRCTDSFLWTYKGIVKFLQYMNDNPYYDAPFDYYMIQFFETNLDFKHYWSMDGFFIQGSNYGLEESTIQRD